jgi:hypothetical protein
MRLDFLANERVAEIRPGKKAAELGFRVIGENREIELFLVAHQERIIIGNEFGRQGEHEQPDEYPQAPVAAAISLEISQSAVSQWREL